VADDGFRAFFWRHLARYDQPEEWVRMTAFRLARSRRSPPKPASGAVLTRAVPVWGAWPSPDPVRAPNVGTPARGVAYDPSRRSWRRLPAPPLQLRWVRGNQWVVWTGRELLAGGVEAGVGGGAAAGASDPAADRWRKLPRSPRLTVVRMGPLLDAETAEVT
jgi:hypothetical protein